MKKLFIAIAALAYAGTAYAAAYHAGATLLCYDCHTMHASMQHQYGSASAPGLGAANAAPGGNWLYAQGTAYVYLLKGPQSASCIACHDGKTFAPDVIGADANTTGDRSAGALPTGAAPYEDWKGHSVGTGAVFAPGNGSFPDGLQCYSCHKQHGTVADYRNLASNSLPQGPNGGANVSYAFQATGVNYGTDVTINLASYEPSFAGGTGATSFSGYYNGANVKYAAQTIGTTALHNRLNELCRSCHAQFHGTPGDIPGITSDAFGTTAAGVGGVADTLIGDYAWEKFVRHPTSGVIIGGLEQTTAQGTSGASGHTNGPGSASSFYTNAQKVKVAWSTTLPSNWAALPAGTSFGAATPLCVSCHNAHGSQKPFGLKFLIAAGDSDLENGSGRYRNLCGQCHRQGASGLETVPTSVSTFP